MAISAADYAAIFGQPGKVVRVTVLTPWGISTQVNAELDEVFLDACTDAARFSDWDPLRIDGYNPRPIRGEDGDELSEWSRHAYAAAWDFFATPPTVPPPGGVWTPDNGLPADFAAPFIARGFTWGAIWKRRDVPHIEWSTGLPARRTAVAVPPTIEELAMPTYTTSTAEHPTVAGRLDVIGHDADDGALWHTWGTLEEPDAGGWEQLDGRMDILPGSLSSSWAADGSYYRITGVGNDGHIWTLTWTEQVGDTPGRWGDPEQTRGKVA